jgi:hypothetical protein
MGIDSQPLPGTVTFQTGLAIVMAGLTRLKVPQRLSPMLCRPEVPGQHPTWMAGLALGPVKLGVTRPCLAYLYVGEPLAVGPNLQIRGSETGMAIGTELWFMAPRAGLGIVQRYDGVDLSIIRPVTPGLVVASECGEMEIGVDPPTKMAVLAEGLVMAVNAVVGVLLGGYPMLGIPETQMRGGHPFRLVTLVAFFNRQILVILVRLNSRHEQTRTDQKAR